MLTDLEQRREDLSNKLMHLSIMRMKLVNSHVSKMHRPRLSNLFKTLDQMLDYEEELAAKLEREDAVMQECEDKLNEELAAIERQIAEQAGNVYEGTCTVVRPSRLIAKDV